MSMQYLYCPSKASYSIFFPLALHRSTCHMFSCLSSRPLQFGRVPRPFSSFDDVGVFGGWGSVIFQNIPQSGLFLCFLRKRFRLCIPTQKTTCLVQCPSQGVTSGSSEGYLPLVGSVNFEHQLKIFSVFSTVKLLCFPCQKQTGRNLGEGTLVSCAHPIF